MAQFSTTDLQKSFPNWGSTALRGLFRLGPPRDIILSLYGCRPTPWRGGRQVPPPKGKEEDLFLNGRNEWTMPFERLDSTRGRVEAGLEDLKLVYRILHRHLAEHPELMDSPFLEELQTYLYERAQEEGVDVSHHTEWDIWLGNEGAPPCEERVKRRQRVDPERGTKLREERGSLPVGVVEGHPAHRHEGHL